MLEYVPSRNFYLLSTQHTNYFNDKTLADLRSSK